MIGCIKKIEKLLKDNSISFETENNYINILNSSSMTRIKVSQYECGDAGLCTAVEVQEFDEFGNQTYNKEFANIGKAFLNRIKRNIG